MNGDMKTPFVCVPELDLAEILLIYPDFAKNSLGTASYPENHLGLNRLASYLSSKGKKVSVLNTTGLQAGNEGPSLLADFIVENSGKYQIIGFHLNSWNISQIINVLARIKEQLKNKLIVLGGPLPTSVPRKVMEQIMQLGFKNLALIQGYGEKKLLEVMDRQSELEQIEGVWSFQNENLKEGNLQRLSNEEMAELPLLNPQYNTFYKQYYEPFIRGENSSATLDMLYAAQGLDTNHGCPFNCSYCSVHVYGHRITQYAPARVCDELENISEKTGFFMYTFTNSNLLFIKRDWIIEFCHEIIKRNLHHYITWSGYHHPSTINLLSTDDLKLIKKSGCDQIVIGIQSVEPRILHLFNRHPSTYKQLKEINAKTKEAGLELVIDYIRGIPGEDLQIVEEFYNYCANNGIEVREFLLKIYPNTEIIKKNIDFSNYELVPITGNLAKELDSFAVVPKKDNPKNIELSAIINESNKIINRNRKIRIGRHYILSEAQAMTLLNEEIPKNTHIPDKVKTAMAKMLELMLKPQKQSLFVDQSPQQMLKTLILAGEDASPMVKKMQERLRAELGEEKFRQLKAQFSR
jgi:radical SAM superfamily enzyme YgiQ (UPF0313 family)